MIICFHIYIHMSIYPIPHASLCQMPPETAKPKVDTMRFKNLEANSRKLFRSISQTLRKKKGTYNFLHSW